MTPHHGSPAMEPSLSWWHTRQLLETIFKDAGTFPVFTLLSLASVTLKGWFPSWS